MRTATSNVDRRVVVTARGGPERLTVVEARVGTPASHEVRLRTLAAGISGMDLMVRQHRFPGFPRVPFTPGVDVVGIVEEVGAEVVDVAPGQVVAALLGTEGGYAESLCVPGADVVAVPDGVDPAEAVCLVANYLTAYSMLHRTAVVIDGERILVQGAAGGVGTALLDLARLVDLQVYGTASPHNHQVVADYGATPIDYHTEDVAAWARRHTAGGFDVVFDPIGGARQLWASYRALGPGGRLVWFGVAGSARHGIGVIPASLATRMALSLLPDSKRAPMPSDPSEPRDWYRGTLATLLDLLASGRIEPLVARRFPLLEAAAAHRFLETQPHAGRVVLVADDGW